VSSRTRFLQNVTTLKRVGFVMANGVVQKDTR
jgi:hypothetical protein